MNNKMVDNNKMKVKKEKVLLTPKDIKPSSPKSAVLSVMPPGVERLEDRRIILFAATLAFFCIAQNLF